MSKAADTPPIFDSVVDENGKARMSWVLFFNSLFIDDVGASFTPTFTGLTESGGAATKSGYFYKVLRRIVMFRVGITPVTSTSSVSGTTYIDGLPFIPIADGFCVVVSGNTSAAIGVVKSGTNRVYLPAWTTVTTPITVIGFCEVAA